MSAGIREFLRAVVKSEQLTDVTIQFGGREKAFNGAPPKITFVPVDDKHDSGKGYAGTPKTNNPRPIWYRGQGIEAHLWAADPAMQNADYLDHCAAVEELLERLLRACQQQTQNGFYYASEGGSFVDAATTALGAAYVLLIRPVFTVTMPLKPEAKIQSMPQTPLTVEKE